MQPDANTTPVAKLYSQLLLLLLLLLCELIVITVAVEIIATC
jgi:hypothetical protein